MNARGLLVLALASVTSLSACGGTVEPSPGSGGNGGSGGGGTGTATATTTSSTTATSGGAGPGSGGATSATSTSTDSASVSTSTGSTPCSTHEECGSSLCLFGTGECARPCEGGEVCEGCDPGTVCSACATSSCPDCDDCRAACVAAQPGWCDADTPCENGDVCMFAWGSCYPPCSADGTCDDPAFECVPCATGSCCGCRDCVDVCLPLEG